MILKKQIKLIKLLIKMTISIILILYNNLNKLKEIKLMNLSIINLTLFQENYIKLYILFI